MTTDADRAARERLAQEARATATTLLDWVGTRVEGARVDGTRVDAGERPRQSPGPCTWCPVCALVAALRGEQPELTATLAEQASGLLVLLRLLVQSHATGSHDHHAPPSGAPSAPRPTPDVPSGWPAEWGAPTWPTDVPWDVAPHATFDPAPPVRETPPVRDTPAEPPAADARTAPDRPTGRRGPRPTPRWTSGAPAADLEEPAVPAPPPEPVATGPVVRNAATGTRRGVQRIPVRRRPRPC